MDDATEAYLPIWLELELDEKSRLFELRAREERAVVVGSHPSCDVRVARAGVASTHFHFEREGDAVVVVPGYRAALIVDNAPAAGPVTLTKSARVEFCGAVLEVTVHDVPPLHMLLDARHGTDRAPQGPDYFARLPDDTDPTVQALVAVAPAQAVADRASGLPEEELDLMTTTAWRAVPRVQALGPQGTFIMKRPAEVSVASEAPVVTASAPLPPIAPTERIRLEPWTAAPADSAGLAPPADALATPSLAPVEHPVVPVKRRLSALEQLGVMASRQPLRVVATALPICAVVALAFVGAARLAGRPHAAVAPPPAVHVHTQHAASGAPPPEIRGGVASETTDAAIAEPAVSPHVVAPAPPGSSNRATTLLSASPAVRHAPKHVLVGR
jgi:hypothetical protein